MSKINPGRYKCAKRAYSYDTHIIYGCSLVSRPFWHAVDPPSAAAEAARSRRGRRRVVFAEPGVRRSSGSVRRAFIAQIQWLLLFFIYFFLLIGKARGFLFFVHLGTFSAGGRGGQCGQAPTPAWGCFVGMVREGTWIPVARSSAPPPSPPAQQKTLVSMKGTAHCSRGVGKTSKRRQSFCARRA